MREELTPLEVAYLTAEAELIAQAEAEASRILDRVAQRRGRAFALVADGHGMPPESCSFVVSPEGRPKWITDEPVDDGDRED